MDYKRRIKELEDEVRFLSKTPSCSGCGVEIKEGAGLGFSVPENEWTDRSRSRPIKIIPLCRSCTIKRILQKEA